MRAKLLDGAPQPCSLSELRIWLVGGGRLVSALSQVCDVIELSPSEWDRRRQDDRRSAFLLVEAGNSLGDKWGDELDRILDYCERISLPRLLWVSGGPLAPYWLDRCDRFERVFSMDRNLLPGLEAAGARMPSILWPAAAPAGDAQPLDADESADAVVWLGGWEPQWPAAWRERLTSVLRGSAERGLRIVTTGKLDGLPADLQTRIAPAPPGESPAAALCRVKVVIGADAEIGSATFAAPVVFDAAAAGAAVITPHEFATIHDFGVGGMGRRTQNLIPIVVDGESAGEEIDRLLADDLLHSEVVSHLQRVIAHNHTYRHRLATLASAVGYRLTPDALDPASA